MNRRSFRGRLQIKGCLAVHPRGGFPSNGSDIVIDSQPGNVVSLLAPAHLMHYGQTMPVLILQ
jgi:hypothetical protein